jgi:hypothetical protein
MKSRIWWVVIVMIACAGGILAWQENSRSSTNNLVADAPPHPAMAMSSPRIPSYSATAPDPKSLGQLLPPENFSGTVREGYEKAKQIPELLAQLPCYCECDIHHGHKSLHTCFETEHASTCSICLSEAVMAYDLHKQNKLSTEQIRSTIIAKYSPR